MYSREGNKRGEGLLEIGGKNWSDSQSDFGKFQSDYDNIHSARNSVGVFKSFLNFVKISQNTCIYDRSYHKSCESTYSDILIQNKLNLVP